VLGQASGMGWVEGTTDVGAPKLAGSTSYDPRTQTYTLTGGGTNMWGARDELHVAWKRLTGDFLLQTRVRFEGAGVDPHRKVGWIIRPSLDADAAYVDAAIHGDGLTSLQFRRKTGAQTEQIESAVKGPDVVQLERRGRTYIMSVAKSGDPFTRTELADLDLGDQVYVGLFICSHNPAVVEKAHFTNTRIVIPPKAGWTPYRDYIGSYLETMPIDTGHRTVVHEVADSMQAPNWTPDGKTLIYNRNGRLYRFDLATRAVTELDTGFAIRNNNDHVLSFDGTRLGISHHTADDNNRSNVYTLPLSGGVPVRVTKLGPSYLHGFSPDGTYLIYTGQRNNELDIYRIPVEGGEEVRLTTATGVDDGSEYTPDGQWIYFNSTRSGLMQIWRMKPDGSGQEQITRDPFNNWFPHIAPDGRSMVVISYGQDVAPGDHPFYRHVYLRHMRLDGSQPKVVAYLFGGQGTINVPSWSPDSTQIAFVSNSAMAGK
jgi:TolB protein